MPQFRSEETSHRLIERLLKTVMEARDVSAALAAFRETFDPTVKLIINGTSHDLTWFEQHVKLIPTRLRAVTVQVTHAAREGNILLDRHIVRAIDRATDDPFALEVIAAYEFNERGRIVSQNELTHVLTGQYDGW